MSTSNLDFLKIILPLIGFWFYVCYEKSRPNNFTWHLVTILGWKQKITFGYFIQKEILWRTLDLTMHKMLSWPKNPVECRDRAMDFSLCPVLTQASVPQISGTKHWPCITASAVIGYEKQLLQWSATCRDASCTVLVSLVSSFLGHASLICYHSSTFYISAVRNGVNMAVTV